MQIDVLSSSTGENSGSVEAGDWCLGSHTLCTHRSSSGMAVKSSSTGGAPNSSISSLFLIYVAGSQDAERLMSVQRPCRLRRLVWVCALLIGNANLLESIHRSPDSRTFSKPSSGEVGDACRSDCLLRTVVSLRRKGLRSFGS